MSGPSSQVQCEQCGASVEYRPEAGLATLVCPNCGHVQRIADVAAPAEADYQALLAASLAASPEEEEAVLTCATCGAQTTVPATVLAERCPFCGTPTVAPTRQSLRRPTSVLPFRLDEQAAREAVVGWEKSLWFKPARFGPADGTWTMSKVYLPYWSFDWDVTTDYEGARGRSTNNAVTWTEVKGTVRTKVLGSTVLGSRGIDRQQGAELEPWDTDKVVGFKPDYLQGVRAECSALTVAQAGDLAHRLLDRRIDYDVNRDIGDDRQRIDKKTSRYHAAAVRLVLMPIWVTHFEHAGTRRQVLVNGRTGEVIGDRPVSRPRLAAAGLAPVAAAIAGGIFLPSALHWSAAHPVRYHALAFWAVLAVLGIVGMIVGGLMTSRARRREPVRVRDLYVQRKGAGTSGLDVDPTSMWRGALQSDGVARGTLVTVYGFACLLIAIMPAAVLLVFPSTVPIIMMHAFAVIALVVVVFAVGKAGRDRSKLLGLDEPAT